MGFGGLVEIYMAKDHDEPQLEMFFFLMSVLCDKKSL